MGSHQSSNVQYEALLGYLINYTCYDHLCLSVKGGVLCCCFNTRVFSSLARVSIQGDSFIKERKPSFVKMSDILVSSRFPLVSSQLATLTDFTFLFFFAGKCQIR